MKKILFNCYRHDWAASALRFIMSVLNEKLHTGYGVFRKIRVRASRGTWPEYLADSGQPAESISPDSVQIIK